MFGKWHLGEVEGRSPPTRASTSGTASRTHRTKPATRRRHSSIPEVFPQPHIWQGEKGSPCEPVEEFDLESRRTTDRKIVEHAEGFISAQESAEAPFFLYLPLTQVHPPLGTHPDFENATGTGVYGDILTELDHNVGRVLDALAEAGLADDTIVILSGDNDAVTEGIGGGSNGPFRGGFTGYEAGLRTVGMIRWPGRIEAGRVSDEIVAAIDVMPTIANLVGEAASIPTDRPIDGVDQSAFLLGTDDRSAREHLLYFIGEEPFSVKWRSFKIHLKTVEDMWAPVQDHLFPPVYDVVNDPGEDNNLMRHSLFSHSWVYAPMARILQEYAASAAQFRNIAPGAPFDGYGEPA